MFQRKKLIIYHALAWIVYLLYSLWTNHVNLPRLHSTEVILQYAPIFLAQLLAFYFCYQLLYPRLLRKGHSLLLLLGLTITALVFVGLRAGVELTISPKHPLRLDLPFYSHLSYYILDSIYYFLPMGAFSAALWVGKEAFRRAQVGQVLDIEKQKANVDNLGTLLNPHFLHNTLNMLYSQAYGTDKRVANGILQLAELMRYLLRDSPDGQVDLQQEIVFLEKLVAFYRVSGPEFRYVELTIDGDPAGHRIAPLLFLPIVENAFVHGLLTDKHTPVRFDLVIRTDTVNFTAQNTCRACSSTAIPKLGLTNLRRRLELLYENHYKLQLTQAKTQFRLFLQLKTLRQSIPTVEG